jgi:hypothetical protein
MHLCIYLFLYQYFFLFLILYILVFLCVYIRIITTKFVVSPGTSYLYLVRLFCMPWYPCLGILTAVLEVTNKSIFLYGLLFLNLPPSTMFSSWIL